MNGLLLRCRSMMATAIASRPTPLPSGYQEVEYVGSDGADSIATTLKLPKTALTIKGAFSAKTNTSKEQYLFADRDVGGVRFAIYLNSENKVVASAGVYPALIPQDAGEEVVAYFTATITGSGAGNTLTISGTANGTYSEMSITGKLREYGKNNLRFFDANGSTKLNGKMIGRVTMNNPNGLVYEFAPCYRTSDNRCGIYELVSNNFFLGSTSMYKGQDI